MPVGKKTVQTNVNQIDTMAVNALKFFILSVPDAPLDEKVGFIESLWKAHGGMSMMKDDSPSSHLIIL